MKKTTWMVKVYTEGKDGRVGWQDFKEFHSAAEADNWLCDYVRKNGFCITDFSIVRR